MGAAAALADDELGPLTEEQWKLHRAAAVQSLPAGLAGKSLPDILLQHQAEIMASTSRYSLTVTDKSRRVGATWGVGADAVLTAGAQTAAGGMDVLYIGYNLDMAREFIDTCAMWAKAFMPACSEIGEFLFDDPGIDGSEDKQIAAFRIRFASGYEIVALSSRPRSLRGRQGYVILDEFAFHDDAQALLDAAMALLIWGGRILVISTHNGVDNPFNLLINDIRAGKKGEDANVVRCTFDDALEYGLYQRVCLKTGKEWSPEAEAAWRANIRKLYGAGAAEELDCIPSQGSGVYLTRALIEACAVLPNTVVSLICPPGFELKPAHERESYVEAWLEQTLAPLIAKLDPNERHAFGEDFARSGDVSCLVPIAIAADLVRRVPFWVEMRNVPFEQQKQVVIYLGRRLPRFLGGKIDSTGNGAYLGEVVMQEFGIEMIEQVKLHENWYIANMPKMKSCFEDRSVLIPANDNGVDDLRQVVIIRGVARVPADVRTEGNDGLPRHGDFAVALCLAIAASFMPGAQYDYRSVGRYPNSRANGDGWKRPRHDDAAGGDGRMFGRSGTW